MSQITSRRVKVTTAVKTLRAKGEIIRALKESTYSFLLFCIQLFSYFCCKYRYVCNEQIFTLRNILEQCKEFQKSLVINFIDFKKAFDSVHRESIWEILKLYGIPHKIINIFISLYTNSQCCIRTKDGYSDMFDIITGVRQGCILSPFLFQIGRASCRERV